mmetsp:Transcript_34843/g.80725  ORF Transcript_34843/g.80725 Transcript_34843/m.80725 type:complete len:430 (+) Transcript_34843:247-1536(+)
MGTAASRERAPPLQKENSPPGQGAPWPGQKGCDFAPSDPPFPSPGRARSASSDRASSHDGAADPHLVEVLASVLVCTGGMAYEHMPPDARSREGRTQSFDSEVPAVLASRPARCEFTLDEGDWERTPADDARSWPQAADVWKHSVVTIDERTGAFVPRGVDVQRGGCTSAMFVGGDRAAIKCLKAARDLFGTVVADLAGAMSSAHGRQFKKSGMAYAYREDAMHIPVCEFTESPLPGVADGGMCQTIDYVGMRMLVAAIDEALSEKSAEAPALFVKGYRLCEVRGSRAQTVTSIPTAKPNPNPTWPQDGTLLVLFADEEHRFAELRDAVFSSARQSLPGLRNCKLAKTTCMVVGRVLGLPDGLSASEQANVAARARAWARALGGQNKTRKGRRVGGIGEQLRPSIVSVVREAQLWLQQHAIEGEVELST